MAKTKVPTYNEPAPLSKEEIAAVEREREQRRGEFLAAQEARLVERMKQIMAEENARDGRGHGITVRD